MRSRVLALLVSLSVALLASLPALGASPGRPDAGLTAYVRGHQPWIPLQSRGVERFSDGKAADTSFWVFTTLRPNTHTAEAQRVCEAVAGDLRALQLPLSLSVLSQPEATMSWYSPQTDRACRLMPSTTPSAAAVSTARVAKLVTADFKALEARQGRTVTSLSCRAPSPSASQLPATANEYPCSFDYSGETWSCHVKPTIATLAGRASSNGLSIYVCVRPL